MSQTRAQSRNHERNERNNKPGPSLNVRVTIENGNAQLVVVPKLYMVSKKYTNL